MRSISGWFHRGRPANDIDAESLAWGRAHCCSAERLDQLVALSRERFGWFTKHLPRSVEYPWILDALGSVSGKRILDIGAGISPIPLALAEAGALVTTVDHSPTSLSSIDHIRRGNEWGFLDYALLDKRVQSLNQDIASVQLSAGTFDAVYSISVIEHMPATVRRRTFDLVARCSSHSASLILTVDLVPGSEQLWNRALGQIVDPPDQHGTLDSMKEELSAVGFRTVREAVVREIPLAEVDCALLMLEQTR